MLERVSGQTGAEQGGLRAAHAAGIKTGGTSPKGWKTEAGPAPWLREFGLVECDQPGYPARTIANVLNSDGTIWFGTIDSTGFTTTHDAAIKPPMKPFFIVYQNITKPSEVRAWIDSHRIRVLDVAGNRESKAPGIGATVEAFLGRVLRSDRTGAE